jgi:nitrogen regulatory protein PII
MNKENVNYKIIFTIVKKSKANKIVAASKEGGAEGGTVLLGSGLGIHEKKSFFGIDMIHEKEIILTLIPEDRLDSVLEKIIEAGKLNKEGTGIGFIIDVKAIRGNVHNKKDMSLDEEALDKMTDSNVNFELIVSIVNKGRAGKVVDASQNAGAEGGTILSGRGTGIHEKAKLLSLMIEPEKDIVLTLVTRSKVKSVLSQIEEEAELNKPGHGIAFVLPVEETIGINHMLKND